MKRRDALKLAGAAALGGWALPPGRAAAGPKPKLLYFTRSAGFEHSVVKREGGALSHSERVLQEMGEFAGIDVECTKDGTVFDGDLDQYAAIAFYTSGDLTKPNKNGTPPMSAKGKQQLLDAVAAGKGFVGIHAATDSFRREGGRGPLDPVLAMIGAEFVVHGKQQESTLRKCSRFPGANDLGLGEAIAFHEEWYTHRDYADDLHVIFVQETLMMVGDCYRRPDYPAVWARMHGKGRVFYTSLGHREDIWTNPFFQAITLGGTNWAMGRVDARVEPNIREVTPGANQLPA